MQKTAPTLGRLLTMSLFALSCFGLLTYLWLAFGGPVPLKPERYRFEASFEEATQLAQEADVTVSGVPIGKVKLLEPNAEGFTRTVMEVQSRYAPIRSDARAILRQKTLLGETYVELTPGSKAAPPLPEGGRLADAQVAPTVQIDEILRAFDEPTRQAFRGWMQGVADGIEGRGRDLNDALGNLSPFAEEWNGLMTVLAAQTGALERVVADTGEVFEALTERQGQLRGMIRGSSAVFSTTGRRDRELREIFRALPTFADEGRLTVRRIERFARETDPLITQLRPAAREFGPTFEQVRRLAPELAGFFRGLGPVAKAAGPGLPALERFLDDSRPVLAQADGFFRSFNPVFDQLSQHRRELSAFFANLSNATQGSYFAGVRSDEKVHYVRTSQPLGPEALASFPRRVGSNRANAYPAPGFLDRLATGLQVFDDRSCNAGIPTLDPAPSAELTDELRQLVVRYFYKDDVPRPACVQQAPRASSGAVRESTAYPHVRADARPAP